MIERTFKSIGFNDAINMNHLKHAAHCCLYTKEYHSDFVGCYLLMQLRFDGEFGFPGGFIDEQVHTSKEILDGLNRELSEEINIDTKLLSVQETDHICSHLMEKLQDGKPIQQIVLNFFAKELTKDQFEEIEKSHVHAIHFPSESLGVIRVPVIKSSGVARIKAYKNYDKFLMNFFKNRFVSNSMEQLTCTIRALNLLDEQELANITKSMDPKAP